MLGQEQILFGTEADGVGYAIGSGFNPSPPPNNGVQDDCLYNEVGLVHPVVP